MWWYPFLFRAPHVQKRASITLATPTRIGLLLETSAICMAFVFRLPLTEPLALWRIVPALTLQPIAVALAWGAVRHLGRQFRINAGLYHDHELVHTGPYAIVRHPIYASLFAMLLSCLLLLTPLPWAALSVAIYILGTEIRVRTEDGLLASRFGEQFDEYRRSVPAYLPGIR
jgi:protein-S-isoprenylcysteine O-methyltransferase Ste14